MQFCMHKVQYPDATLYLQMMAFYEDRLREWCRVNDPSGNRVGCWPWRPGFCEDD